MRTSAGSGGRYAGRGQMIAHLSRLGHRARGGPRTAGPVWSGGKMGLSPTRQARIRVVYCLPSSWLSGAFGDDDAAIPRIRAIACPIVGQTSGAAHDHRLFVLQHPMFEIGVTKSAGEPSSSPLQGTYIVAARRARSVSYFAQAAVGGVGCGSARDAADYAAPPRTSTPQRHQRAAAPALAL